MKILKLVKSGKILLLVTVSFITGVYGSCIDKGNKYYEKGDYETAIKYYEKAIDNDENPALSWFNMGNAVYKSGDNCRAINCYENSVLMSFEFVRGWINLGVLYYEIKDYGACIAAMEQARLLGNNDLMVLNILAAAHTELEHYSNAVVYLEKIIEIDSTNSDACLMLYENAIAVGDKRKALYWLSKYPQNGLRRYDVLLISGNLLLEQNDTMAALSSWRLCTRIDPGRSEGWYRLIAQLHNMNATLSALMEARSALDKNVSNTELSILAGTIAFEAGYFDRAEYFFTEGWNKGSPDAAIGLGNVLTVYSKCEDANGVKRVKEIIDGSNKEQTGGPDERK